jgi:hypothetical protein
LPGLRLHPLKGGLKGFWAVTVSPEMAVSYPKSSAAAPKAGLRNKRIVTLHRFTPTGSNLSGWN